MQRSCSHGLTRNWSNRGASGVHWCARTLPLDLAMRIVPESAVTLLGLVTSQTGTGLPLSLVKNSFVHKILLGASFIGSVGAPCLCVKKKKFFGVLLISWN